MSRLSKADIKMLKGKKVTFKIVDYGEDAKFKKASFWLSSKEIKVKIVTYGEDVKLKEINFGGDFEAIIK